MNVFYVDLGVIFSYGGVILTNQTTSDPHDYCSVYDEKVQYINGIYDTTVFVKDRHGIVIPVAFGIPNKGEYANRFVIRRTITVDSYRMFQVQQAASHLAASPNRKTDTARCWIDTLANYTLVSSYAHRFEISLDIVVSVDDFHRARGMLYNHESDLLLATTIEILSKDHPFSLENFSKSRERVLSEQYVSDSFLMNIEIVDNHGQFGDRYIRIANDVYRVPVLRDAQRKSGIYVLRKTPVTNGLVHEQLKETYYSFEDAEKELMLFKTIELAKTDGDVAGQRKATTAEIEYETTRIKKEAELLAAKEKAAPDLLKKIIDIIKPMSVILLSLAAGVKVIYALGKVAGAAK